MSPERLAEIRREARWDWPGTQQAFFAAMLSELLAEVDRLKVEVIDWMIAKADSDREVGRLTAERDELLDERTSYYEAVLRAEAERDHLTARVTQLEGAETEEE